MIPAEALTLIQYIKQSAKKLQPWESGFLSSIKIQAEQGRYLHAKQSAKLQEIYRRVSGGGRQPREYIN